MSQTAALLSPMELKHLTRDRKLTILRELQQNPVRCSSQLLLLTTDILSSFSASSLGDDRYTVLELNVITALDCGKVAQAAQSYLALQKKFGDKSVRVRKLLGLLLEAQGEERKAKDVYESILRDAPSDSFPVKRLAAGLKASGKYTEAIRLLEHATPFQDEDKKALSLLAVHQRDAAIYKELMFLHTVTHNVERAAYYCEELVLLQPTHFVYHTRHAELCYAMRNLERAATVYAHSLKLNSQPNNLRAAYGLWITCGDLAARGTPSSRRGGGGSDGASAVNVDDVKALQQVAVTHLKQMYAASPGTMPLLDMLLR
jgi:tetratricopeptide (TPR) repeat protein